MRGQSIDKVVVWLKTRPELDFGVDPEATTGLPRSVGTRSHNQDKSGRPHAGVARIHNNIITINYYL